MTDLEIAREIINTTMSTESTLQETTERELTERYPNVATRWSRYYSIKKLIEKNPFLQLNQSPPNEWKNKKQSKEQASQDNRKVVEIKKHEFEKYLDRNNTDQTTLRNLHLFKLASLLANSGRRIEEVISSEFKIDGDDLYYIPAKKKGKQQCKLVLINMSNESFMDMLSQVRDFFQDKNKRYINDTLNRYLKQNNSTITSSHKFRSAYALYLLDGVTDGPKLEGIKKLLCHDNLHSSNRYNYIKFVE